MTLSVMVKFLASWEGLYLTQHMGFTHYLELILSWFINFSILTLQFHLTIIFWFLIVPPPMLFELVLP